MGTQRSLPLALLVSASQLAFCALCAVAAAEDASEEARAQQVVFFELKLLVRTRALLQPVELDAWSGGTLRAEATSNTQGTSFGLIRPLEDPWIFRWYPTRNEVKLGAAIWVERPEGDPHGALAPGLERKARERYARWWDSDVVEADGPAPDWSALANGFWASRHARELDGKDPLHEHPVYPFHVLGPPGGRFAFDVAPNGSVVAKSIQNRMSEPFLPAGWQAWLDGSRPSGYGFWEPERPHWEPRTYPAIAAALRLLAWSPWPDGSPEAAASRGVGATYGSGETPDLAGWAGDVAAALLPRATGLVEGAASPVFETTVATADAERVAVNARAEGSIPGSPELSYRMWRHAVCDRTGSASSSDEIQVWLGDAAETVKLWIRVGYRPLD